MRIDPGSLRMLHTFSVGGPPTGLAAGGGAIWVAQANPQASSVSVNAIDPQFDHVGATKRLGNIVRGGPAAVTAQGATVWVAPSSGLLTRLDSGTGHVDSFDPNSGRAAIALGAGGAVWLTDTEGNNVTRVDPSGLLTPIPVGNGPTGIAVGGGGVWVAYSLEDKIARIDPATPSLTTTIPVGHSPAGVAVGAGSVCVANSGDGTVTRIDPRTKRVQARIPVGGSPQAITIADGRVWVTVEAQTIKPTHLASGGGTLRIESQLDVRSIDPARGALFQYGACANLLRYTYQSGPSASRLIPEVAKALPALSADRRTYTFAIRSGFRFSPPSNEAVTAQTFKYTIERSLNPRINSGYAREFSDIAGAATYTAGKASHISGISVRGETLKIRLLAPAPDFPARVTQPIFCAVPSDTPIDLTGLGTIPSAGPYYVKSFTPAQGVLLARNPNYRGSRPQRFAQIELAVKICVCALNRRGGLPGPSLPLGGPLLRLALTRCWRKLGGVSSNPEASSSDRGGRSPSLLVRLGISWLTNALVLAVVAGLLAGVHVSNVWALLEAAAVFGVLNTALKPLLRLVTLPLAILTLGIAWFFVSLLMLVITKAIVSGFYIDGFWTFVEATLMVWAVNMVLDFAPGPWQITGARRRRYRRRVS